MLHSSFTTVCILFVLCVSVATSQHTTSVRFSPVPQPTSGGVVCIQVVCPTDSLQPSCPSDCASECKFVPDQCCPQVTVAICDSSSTGTPTLSNGVSSTTATVSPSLSSSATSSSLPPASSSSSLSLSPSSSTASPKPNSGTYVRPAFYSTLVVMILVGVVM